MILDKVQAYAPKIENTRMRNLIKQTFLTAAWAPLAVFMFYVSVAIGTNAYVLYPWFDMPAHFLGGFAITYFFRAGIANSQEVVGQIPAQIQLLLAIGLTSIAAVIWEFVEYIADLTLGTNWNWGLTDTLSDLFLGLIGAIVFVVIDSRRSSTRVTNNVDRAFQRQTR